MQLVILNLILKGYKMIYYH